MAQIEQNVIHRHPKFKQYGADRHGNIYSFKYTEKKLSIAIVNYGYNVFRIQYRKKQKSLMVSRFLFECFLGRCLQKGEVVDHIDRNKTNDNIDNLRLATQSLNLFNRLKYSSKQCTSSFKGVHFSSREKKFIARITVNGKTVYGGAYHSEIEAAKAYNRLIVQYGLQQYAILNKVA